MTNTPRKRVVRGVREGGQFATEERSESAVSLAPSAEAFETTQAAADDELNPEQMLTVALMSARHHVHVRNLRFVSPEDIAQSTMETALRARFNNPGTKFTRAYINQIAGGHVNIGLRGNLRAEDRKAIGIYTRRVKEMEDELGRHSSAKERKALAMEIRDTWPDQRHKPSVNFVELAEMRIVSMDRPVGDGEQTLGELVAEHTADNDDDLSVDADSVMGQTLTAATTGRKAEARRAAWHAIADHTGAPDATPGTLSRSRAAECRKTLADAGGVRQAVRDWNAGSDSTPACRALFAPFGDLSADQRDEVVEVFTAHSAYAEDLYDSALRTASKAA